MSPRARLKRAPRSAVKSEGKTSHKRSGVRWGRVALVALLCCAAVAGAFWLSLPSAARFRSGQPDTTALMAARAREAKARGRAARRVQSWMPLGRISPWLADAVVNSEDARFYEHRGFDAVEAKAALEKALEQGKLGRGASTLTQQLAKNLWLGEERSLLRKAKELFLARRLESLGKDRVLELYLNVVEWGDGIYGAEAAARTWFGKPAAQLLPEEAAVLAAMLPAPRRRNPRRPSQRLREKSEQVLELFRLYGELTPEQLAEAQARLKALLG
jgi:monofunctional biosynthetic peptidoglycan transglycosylase